MSPAVRRRLTSIIAVAGTLSAVTGGVVAVLGGGAGPAIGLPVSGHLGAAVLAHSGGSAQRTLASAAHPLPGPAGSATRPASRAQATVPASRPPVVDGVRRYNVGSAHSPRLAKALSHRGQANPAGRRPADAGARGIDVADHQHPDGAAIDWAKVARAGYKFAFVKVSEGDYYVNPYAATDLAQAAAAGLYVTPYHFAVPNVSGGASQADYAVTQTRAAAGGRTLPPALDIEYNPYGATCYGLSPAHMVSWISAYVATVDRLTGQLPVIYTTTGWWHRCTGDSGAFGADPLWIAAWGSSPDPLPSGWQRWTFWQYTSNGHVPGIKGPVDVSYFRRADVQLLSPGGQTSAAGAAVRLRIRSLSTAGQPPAFTAAGLPQGLSISHNGLITGTIAASAAGQYTVTVQATTPAGRVAAVQFSWTVTGSSSPSPSPSPSPSGSSSPSGSPSPSGSSSPSATP